MPKDLILLGAAINLAVISLGWRRDRVSSSAFNSNSMPQMKSTEYPIR
jgi:hypothetical protein